MAKEAARILRLEGWGFKNDRTLQGLRLFDANLQGVDLWDANLQGANLSLANLLGAELPCEQLWKAKTLEGATLPDGTILPGRSLDEFLLELTAERSLNEFLLGVSEPPWREALEAWCETAETDEYGYIKVDDDDKNDNND